MSIYLGTQVDLMCAVLSGCYSTAIKCETASYSQDNNDTSGVN